MDTAVKQNFSKYSGLPLASVIFLATTSAPIDQGRKRVVWLELLYRYFRQGRTFNLYKHLHGEPVVFGNTIGWELEREDVEIPVEHAEDFIKNLMAFIKYVDERVLNSEGLRFEWQLHELAGIKSMIERVRDAKIKDMNTRQKVNLFIDKINDARKNTLILIEAAKAEAEKATKSEGKATETQIVVSEEKTSLMKQELKHLDIPMSRITKKQWVDMMNEFNIYYPEDQKKLVRLGIKKYTSEILERKPWEAFFENMELKDSSLNMYAVLIRCLRYDPAKTILNRFDTIEQFLAYIKSWYHSCENTDNKTFEELRLRITEKITSFGNGLLEPPPRITEAKEYARSIVIQAALRLLEDSYWIVEKYANGPLSKMLLDTQTIQVPSGNYKERKSVSLQYQKDGSLIQLNPVFVNKEVSMYTHYHSIYEQLGSLAGNSEPNYPGGEFFIINEIPLEYHDKIRNFFKLALTLKLDTNLYKVVSQKGPASEQFRPSRFSFEKSSDIEWLLRYKFLRKAITPEEIRWLYTTDEGYAFFKVISDVSRSHGAFHNQAEYLAYYLEDVLPMFDFSKEEDRRHFFRLDFSSADIYQYKRIDPELAEKIVLKLQKESPHEVALVYEFFDGISNEYSFFEVNPEYENLSAMEKLLLMNHGIEIGQTRTETGYREKMTGGVEVSFTTEQARTKFIFEYYKNFYAKSE
ncbi:hypothetical protein EHV15_35660 [Paenibacillus oralis]|uniref:Uncharacterized protein n=1 Tax=Paenibacillus oralis TaxID=2490856 RepID=A0A3P3TA39_9BACL|nr:hypothetical protein [Paenibacillus oralis]RRJ54911.1 hypothetical protein EHV15_35660 [Paenibacillus oralis]